MAAPSRGEGPRARVLRHGLVVAGLLFAAYLFLVVAPRAGTIGFDAFAYWAVDAADPYVLPAGELGAFLYSPVVARVLDPAGLLPWPVFLAAWTAAALALLAWMGGRGRILLLLAFPPVALELYHGNVHLLLAAVVVAGRRHPALWAIALLTKVTPGIGLAWFLVRREWRPLGIALGTTMALVVASFAVDGPAWADWIALLASSLPGTVAGGEQTRILVPLLVRLPLALLLVGWGARTGRYWTVAVATTLAVPVLWPSSLAMLAALLVPGRPPVRIGGSADPGAVPAPGSAPGSAAAGAATPEPSGTPPAAAPPSTAGL